MSTEEKKEKAIFAILECLRSDAKANPIFEYLNELEEKLSHAEAENEINLKAIHELQEYIQQANKKIGILNKEKSEYLDEQAKKSPTADQLRSAREDGLLGFVDLLEVNSTDGKIGIALIKMLLDEVKEKKGANRE